MLCAVTCWTLYQGVPRFECPTQTPSAAGRALQAQLALLLPASGPPGLRLSSCLFLDGGSCQPEIRLRAGEANRYPTVEHLCRLLASLSTSSCREMQVLLCFGLQTRTGKQRSTVQI
ncbi:expressed unknown protein [Seminavis robusta]|uniref:Uncharacterized protein n=1 Tax=Seminavis robusta TaxID=568900 RepID=A0A9N8D5N4_9STRA|nr:expressed unknown protein [Seminavis robusta]|eukprot:Sro10_g008271.1  (117) ;mRNA; f:184484-184834